jgi:hypothetical protein
MLLLFDESAFSMPFVRNPMDFNFFDNVVRSEDEAANQVRGHQYNLTYVSMSHFLLG